MRECDEMKYLSCDAILLLHDKTRPSPCRKSFDRCRRLSQIGLNGGHRKLITNGYALDNSSCVWGEIGSGYHDSLMTSASPMGLTVKPWTSNNARDAEWVQPFHTLALNLLCSYYHRKRLGGAPETTLQGNTPADPACPIRFITTTAFRAQQLTIHPKVHHYQRVAHIQNPLCYCKVSCRPRNTSDDAPSAILNLEELKNPQTIVEKAPIILFVSSKCGVE